MVVTSYDHSLLPSAAAPKIGRKNEHEWRKPGISLHDLVKNPDRQEPTITSIKLAQIKLVRSTSPRPPFVWETPCYSAAIYFS